MDIFESISLPMLEAASKGHKLRHIVQFSPELPDAYQKRLQDAASRYPFLVLSDSSDESGETHPYTVSKMVAAEDEPYAIYRLDDDDFVSATFFDDMAPHVTRANVGMRISLAAGVTGIYDQGTFTALRYAYHPYIAIGLAGIYGHNDAGQFIAPPTVAHTESDKHGSVIVDARHCSYFWTRHAGQDTDFGSSGDFERTRANHIGLPAVPREWDLLESFPVLSGRLEEHTESLVTGETSIPLEGKTFPVHASGAFSLSIDATFPGGMFSNSALISFSFSDPTALESDNNEFLGMTRSPSSEIGMYRYLVSYQGRRQNEYGFELPEGVAVEAIKVMPFGSGGKSFTVHEISARSIHKARL